MTDKRVFISYSRRDGALDASDLREKFENLGIPVWQDIDALEGGPDWWSQIADALTSRALEHVVFLVTPESLKSEIVRKEIRLAREQGKNVCPVRGRAMASLSELPRRVGHVYDLGIPAQYDRLIHVLKMPAVRRKRPNLAPLPPESYVHRPAEYESLKAKLLDPRGDAVAIVAALRGAGGYGKTTLAQKLAHDPDIAEAFFDGILWVELGERPEEMLKKLLDLTASLTGEAPPLNTVNAAAACLGEALGDRSVLLVVDDLWRAPDLRHFMAGGSRTARLITTRNDSEVPASAQRQEINALETSQAVSMLADGLPSGSVAQCRVELEQLAILLGRWALLLTLANGVLRKRIVGASQPLIDAIAFAKSQFDQRGITAFDPKRESDRSSAVVKTIEVSLDQLDSSDRARFLELAVFPEGADVPVAVAAGLWRATSGLGYDQAEDLLVELRSLSLLLRLTLSADQKTFGLHDTIRHYLRDELVRPRDQRRVFLETADHQRTLPAANEKLCRYLDDVAAHGTWPSDVRNYYYLNFPRHLKDGHQDGRLSELLTEPRWIQGQLAETNSCPEVERSLAVFGSTPLHEEIRRTIRLCANIFDRDPQQLLPQLMGRLTKLEGPARDQFLSETCLRLSSPSLLPLSASLVAPTNEMLRIETEDRVDALVPIGDASFAYGPCAGRVDGYEALARTKAFSFDVGEPRCLVMAELPDSRIAWASDKGAIHVWDMRTEVEVEVLNGHTDWVRALAVLDDARLASAGDDCIINVWEFGTKKPARPMAGHADWIRSLSVLPDGNLVSGSWDKTVRIWDTGTGHELNKLTTAGRVTAVCALGDGRVAFGMDNGSLEVWDPGSGAIVQSKERHDDWVRHLVQLADGTLVSGGDEKDKTIRAWSPTNGAELVRIDQDGAITALAVSASGNLLSCAADKVLRVWNSLTTGPSGAAGERPKKKVTALGHLEDNGSVAGFSDGTIAPVTLQVDSSPVAVRAHQGAVTALSPLFGDTFASGGSDGAVHIWNRRFDKIGSIENEGGMWAGGIGAAVFLESGRLVFSSGDLGLWLCESSFHRPKCVCYFGEIRTLRALSGGGFEAVGESGSTRLFDENGMLTDAETEGYDEAPPNVLSCYLSEGMFACASPQNAVSIVRNDAGSWSSVCHLELENPATAMCATPDGLVIVGDSWGRVHWLYFAKDPGAKSLLSFKSTAKIRTTNISRS